MQNRPPHGSLGHFAGLVADAIHDLDRGKPARARAKLMVIVDDLDSFLAGLQVAVDTLDHYNHANLAVSPVGGCA